MNLFAHGEHGAQTRNRKRRSVGPADIRKYEMFATSLQQARAFGAQFKFDDADGNSAPAQGGAPAAPAPAQNDVDDLYG